MTIYDHITRDHEMASRTRAALDELRSLVAKLEARIADAREDYAALEELAAAVVRARETGGDVNAAIDDLRDGGRDGWWATEVTK